MYLRARSRVCSESESGLSGNILVYSVEDFPPIFALSLVVTPDPKHPFSMKPPRIKKTLFSFLREFMFRCGCTT